MRTIDRANFRSTYALIAKVEVEIVKKSYAASSLF